MVKLQTRLIVITGLLAVCLLGGSCASSQDFDARLSSIVEPYRFSIAKWEYEAIPREVNQWIFDRQEEIDDEIGVVTEYFSFIKRIKTLKSEIQAINAGSGQSDSASLESELNRLQEQRIALKNTVEKIIERQIRETLAQQGIFNPIDRYIKLKVIFPPVNFELDKLPCLLVVSPRHRIESMREILLQPNISLEEIEDIEAKVDKLDVSSLVVKLGGLSTPYPTLVTNEASLQFTIDTATEEWLHQYLVFKPLGFLYLLDLAGVSRNYEIATMNETLASIVSKEISSIVYEKYYPEYGNGVNQTAEPEFDFNREMREIRKIVDKYLARGEIEQAEELMEQKRQYLASMGRYIRKLNQAYFAWHGTYADRPTSISPIGLELKELRSQSASLKDFLNSVAVMTSRQDLRDSIK
jgi:predicted  nucleic acid-binding Zn-ribbon protein